MILLSWSILLNGWSLFIEEEKAIIGTWILFVSAAYYFVDVLSFPSFFLTLGSIVLLRKIFAGGICCSNRKLHGQTIVITGSNTGIGRETARDLARRGARIILACRDLKKAESVARELQAETGSEVTARRLDLASFESVAAFASRVREDHDKLHCLINNAGIMMCPYQETSEGLEMQLGTNHFGHFLLTELLLPLLDQRGHDARVINVSSMAHYRGQIPFDDMKYKRGYSPIGAYANSKLANILHVRQLAKVLEGSRVQCFSVHPGMVESELGRHLPFPLGFAYAHLVSFVAKTTREGAQTTLHCATDAVQQESFYFSDCMADKPSAHALSDPMAARLWTLSKKSVEVGREGAKLGQ